MSSPIPPTGGGNDPNTWKTDPGYGQTGANRGAGYNPAYGSYDQFKAGRRAYRARFQPGGENYQKYMRVAQALGAGRPQSEADVRAILAQQGFLDQKEQGQSMVRNWLAEFGNSVNGMDQYDLGSGQAFNVATSDVNARGGRPMTAEDWAHVNQGFQGRIDEMLGANRFSTEAHPGLHPDANGFLTNGTNWFDQQGYAVDPSTGQRTGRRYNGVGGMGGNGGSLGQMAGLAPPAAPLAPPPMPSQANPLTPPPAPSLGTLAMGGFGVGDTSQAGNGYPTQGLLPEASKLRRRRPYGLGGFGG